MSKRRPFKLISDEPIEEDRTETELDCALNYVGNQSSKKLKIDVDLEAFIRSKIPPKKAKRIRKPKVIRKQNLILRVKRRIVELRHGEVGQLRQPPFPYTAA